MGKPTANEKIVIVSEARDEVLDAYDDAIVGMSEPLRYDLLCGLIETLTNCKDEIEECRAARRYRRMRHA